jgi:hypothetical protein
MEGSKSQWSSHVACGEKTIRFFDADAYHEQEGFVLEVEAGRDTLYASERLRLPLKGVLLIGY